MTMTVEAVLDMETEVASQQQAQEKQNVESTIINH